MRQELINLIVKLSEKYPTLRVCQILQNPFPPTDMYYITDEELLSNLKEYYEVEEEKEKNIEIPGWGCCD
jgi:hypothetical protein